MIDRGRQIEPAPTPAPDRPATTIGRGVRLRELSNLTDEACAELTLARRLGFPIDGGSPPGTTWEQLHAWERAIYLRGDQALGKRDRIGLVADLAEHLAPILGTQIARALVQMIGPAFGLELVDEAGERPRGRADGDSRLDRVRRGDADAVRDLEGRAAELAGKIQAKGGAVPTGADEDATGAAAARRRLGFNVRKV